MSINFDDDMDAFFDQDDFATEALLVTGAEDGYETKSFIVIFDENSEDFKTGAGTLVAGSPRILVKSSDVKELNLKKGDIVIVDERRWILSSPGRIDSPGIESFKMQVKQ